jgi:hypothetical protein
MWVVGKGEDRLGRWGGPGQSEKPGQASGAKVIELPVEFEGAWSEDALAILQDCGPEGDAAAADSLDLLDAVCSHRPDIEAQLEVALGLTAGWRARPPNIIEEATELDPDVECIPISEPLTLALLVAQMYSDVLGGPAGPELLVFGLASAKGSIAHRVMRRGTRRRVDAAVFKALFGHRLPLRRRFPDRLMVDRSRSGDAIVRGEFVTTIWHAQPWRERMAVVGVVLALAIGVNAGAQIQAVLADRSELVAASGLLAAGDPESIERYAVLYAKRPSSRTITAGFICALDQGGFRDQAYANVQRRAFPGRGDVNLMADPACQGFLDDVPNRGMVIGLFGEFEHPVYWQSSPEAPAGMMETLEDKETSPQSALAAAACVNHHADFRLLAAEQVTIVLRVGLDEPLPDAVAQCLDEMGSDYRMSPEDQGPLTVLPADAKDRLAPRAGQS